MIKLYNFSFENKISKEEWALVISQNFKTAYELIWLSADQCYFYSEENINQTLSELIPIMENDLACQITVLVSHSDEKLSHQALQFAIQYQNGKLFNMTDLGMLALKENRIDFLSNWDNYFKNVDNELLRTMTAYLANSSSGLKTAETLYIHRNTWLYRFNKFYQLTKLDLQDGDDASFFRFWLAWQRIK